MSELDAWPTTPLGEIGELSRGRRFTKADYVSSGLGCIHYAQIYTHFGVSASRALTYLPDTSRSRMRLAKFGDLIIAATSENVADVGKATVWLGSDEVAVHDDCYIFRHNLDPTYVSYFFSSQSFYSQKVKYLSETKVVRISSGNLRLIEIPVPPVSVQARIVEVVGAVDDRIAAAVAEADALKRFYEGRKEDLFARYGDTGNFTKLGEVLEEVRRPIVVDPEVEYRQIGIRSHGRGIFIKEAAAGASLGAKKIFWVKPGDLVINIVFAWEGAVATVPAQLDGYCGSHRFPAFRHRNGGDVEFFRLFFSARPGLRLLASCSPGGAGRNRTLSRRRLMESGVRLPSLQEQKRAVAELLAMEASVAAVRAESDRLRAVRTALLSGLLSRDIDIESIERRV